MPKTKYTRRKDGRLMTKIKLEGNLKPKYIYGKTDEEIDEQILEFRMQEKQGLAIGDNTTLKNWAIRWFKTQKENKVAYKTEEKYRNAINNHILPYFNDMTLKEILPINIQEFINTKTNFSNALHHDLLITLRQVFNSAIDNKLITTNPAKGIKGCGKATQEKKPLTATQQEEILKIVKDTRAELFVNIALYCGLRKGEILALTWEDIDFKNRIVSVNKAVYFEGNIPYIGPTKSNAGERQVPFPVLVLKLLCKTKKNNKYIVSSANGKLMSKTAFSRMWEIVVDGLQKPNKDKKTTKIQNMKYNFTPHILRHTYCTELHTAEIDLKTAQHLMGHSDVSITAKIYTHLDNTHVLLAKDKLDLYYKSCQKSCQG